MRRSLIEYTQKRDVIVMTSAGVSAGKPSVLPGWIPLNEAIVKVLIQRSEAGNYSAGRLSDIRPLISSQREADRFPPDYQA